MSQCDTGFVWKLICYWAFLFGFYRTLPPGIRQTLNVSYWWWRNSCNSITGFSAAASVRAPASCSNTRRYWKSHSTGGTWRFMPGKRTTGLVNFQLVSFWSCQWISAIFPRTCSRMWMKTQEKMWPSVPSVLRTLKPLGCTLSCTCHPELNRHSAAPRLFTSRSSRRRLSHWLCSPSVPATCSPTRRGVWFKAITEESTVLPSSATWARVSWNMMQKALQNSLSGWCA